MQHLKIVLISLYCYDSFAIRSLYSLLKNKGYDVEAVFFKQLVSNRMEHPSDKEMQLLLGLLKQWNPALIGLSVRSPFFGIAKDLILRIRGEVDSVIVLGGIHATICPEECIRYADIVCIGEGEDPLLELCRNMAIGRSITQIRNLWIRKGNKVIKNDIRPLLQDLDVSGPDYSDARKYFIDNDALSDCDPILENKSYSIMASRGCPFQCTFCINSMLKRIYKGKGSYVRKRSVVDVINELMVAKRRFRNLKRVMFIDEVFVLDKEWIGRFVK